MHPAQWHHRSNRACSCGTVYNLGRAVPKGVCEIWNAKKTDILDPCGTLLCSAFNQDRSQQGIRLPASGLSELWRRVKSGPSGYVCLQASAVRKRTGRKLPRSVIQLLSQVGDADWRRRFPKTAIRRPPGKFGSGGKQTLGNSQGVSGDCGSHRAGVLLLQS